MRPQDQKRIDVLEAQVKELMAFMRQKKETQLSYPLDYPTQQILQDGVPIVTGPKVPGAIAAADGYIPVRVNNKIVKLMYDN